MSLLRTMIRLSAVAALRSRTWAEARVFDSDNTPLAQAISIGDEPKPYIVVYTDADNRMDINATDVYTSARNISLVIEIGVASAISVDGGGVSIQTPATDQGMELAVDITESQVLAAILGDPRSPWGELLKLLVTRVIRIPSVRGGRGDKGSRWAARQMVFVCDPIFDVPPGVTIDDDHPAKQFIALARADTAAGLVDVATIFENLLASEATAYPSWEQAQAWLGLSKRGIRATGVAPLADPITYPEVDGSGDDITQSDGMGPVVTEVSLDDELNDITFNTDEENA